MAFTTDIPINHPRRVVVDFFRNPETWFRLNPEWEFRKLTCDPAMVPCTEFILDVRYDRSEREATYHGSISGRPEETGITLLLNGDLPRQIHLTFAGKGSTVHSLILEEFGETEFEPRKQTELVLWLKSTADYISISNRRAWHWRVLRYLIDRIWLRMSPIGRRVAFLVIAFELAGLIFLVGLLMFLRWL